MLFGKEQLHQLRVQMDVFMLLLLINVLKIHVLLHEQK
jgi:hypothetical protein